MKEERRQILDLLAEGKISAADAERLLDKLAAVAPDAAPAGGDHAEGRPARPKYFRVHVDSADGDKVNIRVPLALIRTGIKLSAVLPERVTRELSEQGVDLRGLSELDAEELNEALRELQVDVDSEHGDVVRIFCE